MPRKKATPVEVVETKAEQPKKKKRALSKYNEFVREHYSDVDVQAAKVRDRLKLISVLWAEHKLSMAS